MPEYIKMTDAITTTWMILRGMGYAAEDNPDMVKTVAAVFDTAPAADVVEVVRCRDCIFWDTSWSPEAGGKNGAHYCPRCHLVTLKDSFCSGAYRKDGGQDDV